MFRKKNIGQLSTRFYVTCQTSTPLFANADSVLAYVTSIPRYYAPPRAVTASTKTPSIQTSQTVN